MLRDEVPPLPGLPSPPGPMAGPPIIDQVPPDRASGRRGARLALVLGAGGVRGTLSFAVLLHDAIPDWTWIIRPALCVRNS